MDINEIIRQVTEEICSKYGAQTQTPAASDGYTPADMAKYIDHTYLKPEASVNEIRKICDEAKKYHCASVCVNPSYIQYVAQQLEGSGVTPCCVIAFPFGTSTPEAKAFEASDAASKGAREIDMVINVGAIKSGDWLLVKRDIEGVVNAVKGRAKVKVIRRREGQGLHRREARRRCLREDLHRLFHRRRYRRGCPPDARDRRPRDGRQGLRRRSYL